jgi:hypothetical protein
MLVLPRQRRTAKATGTRTRNVADHTSDHRRIRPFHDDHDHPDLTTDPRQRLPTPLEEAKQPSAAGGHEPAVRSLWLVQSDNPVKPRNRIRARKQLREKITMRYWRRLSRRVTPTMKKFIITAGAALLLAIPTLAPVAAQASPIGECGGVVADGVQNITTRNVSCSDARAFAQKISDLSRWYSCQITFPGWHTYSVHFHYQGWRVDVRATRISRVIHFQIGPYGVSDGGNGKCAGIPAGQPCW